PRKPMGLMRRDQRVDRLRPGLRALLRIEGHLELGPDPLRLQLLAPVPQEDEGHPGERAAVPRGGGARVSAGPCGIDRCKCLEQDTSAIVLCSKCRNPICTLCAKETPEGLTCSPSCGPPDLVGVRERRNVALINLALAAAVILVIGE